MGAAIKGVLDASGAHLTKSVEVEFVTPPERAGALAKALGYRETAGRMTDPAEADAYDRLAAKTLREAGLQP